MKPIFKWLWVMVAIALVAPTAPLDLPALFDDAGPHALAGDEPGRQHSHRHARSSPARQPTPPPPLRYGLCPGQTVAFPYQVYLPPAPIQADILFAFDTTGSMGNVVDTVQVRSVEIMSSLQALIGDVQFGLIDFRDYPLEPYGKSDDWPYRLRQVLTPHTSDVRRSIQELEGDGGRDQPEAYARALYEAYADESIYWRPDARRFILMFGDSIPHDNDLNAGVPTPQPHKPNQQWNTGYPPLYIDPGRDAREGTADDLDFQQVLSDLAARSITLLFIVSDAKVEFLTMDELLVYWQVWAARTGPGGDARMLEDLGGLPDAVMSLVSAAVRHIDQLTVLVAPSWYDEWITIVPPSYRNLDIPSTGLYLDFQVTITVPPNVPADHYVLDLIFEADSTVYWRQQIAITVPDGCFATPTPTWAPLPTLRPRRLLYMPFVANHLVNWRP